MKRLALKLLSLIPIPIVVVLVIWSLERPLPPPIVLKKHATKETVKGFSLPTTIKGGWKVRGKVVQYDEKGLYDRIDGAAPVYINAGFVYSLGAELGKANMKESVVADLYFMGTPARALGIYATERDASYTFIEVGKEGYTASGSLNFWQGEFYVKLAGYEEGAAMDKALKELALGISALLPKPKSVSSLRQLGMLPTEDKQPNSEGYSHTPLADVKGLNEVFYADYKHEEERYRLFVVRPKTAAEVTQRFNKVKDYFQKDSAKLEESSEGGISILIATADSITTIVARSESILAGGIDISVPTLVPIAKAKLIKRLKSLKANKAT